MEKVKRKSLLTEEQKALLDNFQKSKEDSDETPLNENLKVKASSAAFKPMINKSGSRGK